MDEGSDGERWLTTSEVAKMFSVTTRTVLRWEASGRLSSVRTSKGKRRYRESEVRALYLKSMLPEQPGPTSFS